MGLFDIIEEGFGEITGFGGKGQADPKNMDENAYRHLYEEALAAISGVGSSGNNAAMREGVEKSALSMLGDLENNAEGRKQNFMEDMSRGFQADMTGRARAAGGTGNMAQALSAPGDFYDSEARARSRGLNDLYSAAINDIGNLGGVQNQFFNQDFNKAQSTANIKLGELGAKRGIVAKNLEDQFNVEQAAREKRANTYGGLAKASGFGGMFGGK